MIYKSNRLAPSSDIVTNKSRNHLLLAVTVTLCLAGAERAMAQRIWTGGGTDAKWSTAANWSTSPPTAFGGAINFSGNTRQSSTNDISNVLLGQLTFGNDGTAAKSGGFALSGNSFTTSNTIFTTAVSGSTPSGTMLTDTIGMNIDMTQSPLQIFNIGNNHHLAVNGVLGSKNSSGLLKRSPGNLILGGANTFSGATQLDGGNLILNNNLALQNSALMTTGAGRLRLGTGITTPTFGGLSGATGNLATVISSGYSSVTSLTLNPNSGSVTYSGVIANGASGMSLTKTGAGTQSLGGANTYTGNTILSGGTLRLGVNDALPDTSAVTIAAGTLDVSTFADDAGTLDVTDTTATINIGLGGTMAFANSSSVDWVGGKLHITGDVVSGSSIRFGMNSNGLTTGQLALISVNYSNTCTLDSNGYLVYDTYDTTPIFLNWSGDTALNLDLNKDSFESGVAWLLGASGPYVDATELVLPTRKQNANPTELEFNLLRPELREGSELHLKYRFSEAAEWIQVRVPDETKSEGAVAFLVGASEVSDRFHVRAAFTHPTSSLTGVHSWELTATPPTSMPSSTQHFQQGADKLVVYRDVPTVTSLNQPGMTPKITPGMTPSNHYRIRVRSAATNGLWKYAFPLITKNLWSQPHPDPMNPDPENPDKVGFYFKHTADWTHTYANIEMNSPVEIEISRADGAPINSAAAHPVAKASTAKTDNGKVYLTLPNPVAITVDIDGQMDSKYTGSGYTGPDIHTVSIFANEILDKQIPGSPGVVEMKPGDNLPPPSTYNTLYFSPGVHNIGRNFKVYPSKKYYIGGDTLVYGTMNNIGSGGGRNITIYGYGTLSGDLIKHPDADSDANPKSHESKPISIENAETVTVEGICVANPAFHGVNLRAIYMNDRSFKSQTSVKSAKVISWRVNGDGIGSAHEIDNCFIRSADDCSYLKGNRRKCIFWNDTNGAVFHMSGMEHRMPIVVNDCDIIYARSVFHTGRGGRGFNQRGEGEKGQRPVTLKVSNIRMTDPYPAFAFFQLYSIIPGSASDAEPGSSFSGITFENITVAAHSVSRTTDVTKAPDWRYENVLHGHAEAQWSNLTFKDVWIAGKKMTSLSDFSQVNEHVKDIKFE